MASAARLTVIVIPLIGGESLDAYLDDLAEILASDSRGDRCPILVVLAAEEARLEARRARHPGVSFLRAHHPAVPLRRRQAVEAARGDLVALLEDTALPSAGWLAAALRAFDDRSVAAAGGPVTVSRALPLRYQALGYSEYGRFLPGHAAPGAGAVAADRLPGNNLAYRRDVLLQALLDGDRGLVEGAVNERLLAQGFKLALHPAMAVTYRGADRHGARLATRLQHGRLYAAGRAAGESWPTRLALFAKALLLPLVLPLRALAHGARAIPPASLPGVASWIFLMEGAWALGEAIGTLAGEGRGLESWR